MDPPPPAEKAKSRSRRSVVEGDAPAGSPSPPKTPPKAEKSRTYEVSEIVSTDGMDLMQYVQKGSKVRGDQPSTAVKKIMTKIFRESEKKAVSARVTLSENRASKGQVDVTYDAIVKRYAKRPSFQPSGAPKPVHPSFQVITQKVI